MVVRISDKNQNYSNVTKLLVKPNFLATLGIYVDAMHSCFDNSEVETIPLCVAK